MTLTRRLFILTAVALLPALAIVFYNLLSSHREREREVHDLARRTSQLASLEMERIVSGAEGVLRTLASAPIVKTFDTVRCSQYFADVNAQLPQFTLIAAIDGSGTLRCHTTMPSTALHPEDRPHFKEVMRTGQFTVGEYTVSPVNGRPNLPLAVPITGPDGDVIGAVVGGLDLEWLGKRLRERDSLRASSITIADRNGVIVAREPDPGSFVGSRIPDGFLHLVTADTPGTLEVESQDGTRRILGFRPATLSPASGLYVSVGMSQKDAFAPIWAATYRGLAMAVLGGLVAFVLAWWTGHRLIRAPLGKLVETVRSWRVGNVHSRTGMTEGSGEIGSAGAAVDGLLDELEAGKAAREKAEDHRRLLVEELDHRVKNILSTVQAVATQTFKNDGTPRDSLDSFSARLAAMAEAHRMLMTDNWSRADIRNTIEIALGPFDRDDRKRFSVSGPPLILRAKAALALSMAVHELCTNAVKYGALRHDKGSVTIAWGTRCEEGEERFDFSWAEHGGPPVQAPAKGGFGSKMIQKALAAELNATVDLSFPDTGVVCKVSAAAASILADGRTLGPPSERM